MQQGAPQGVTLTSSNCFECNVVISIVFMKGMLIATLHDHSKGHSAYCHEVTIINTPVAGIFLQPLLEACLGFGLRLWLAQLCLYHQPFVGSLIDASKDKWSCSVQRDM